MSGVSGRSADPTRSAQRWPVSLHPGEGSDALEGGLTQDLVGPVGSHFSGLSAEALRPAALSDEADKEFRGCWRLGGHLGLEDSPMARAPGWDREWQTALEAEARVVQLGAMLSVPEAAAKGLGDEATGIG